MKIALASDDGKTIAQHFGRTKGFVIVTIEEKKFAGKEYRKNKFTAHAMDEENHGHGHGGHSHEAVIEALSDCSAVISRGMGRRLFDDLMNNNIQPFVTNLTDIKMAVMMYIKDELIIRPEDTCEN